MLDRGLSAGPATLEQPVDFHAHWLSPDLLLSQTCGYPLRTSLAGRVQYVGTPRYRAPGCQGPLYSSAIVVRADDPASTLADLRGFRLAFNTADSQSGVNAIRAAVAPLATNGRFFGEVVASGAHRASLQAIQTQGADVAAVDAVTLALLARDQPDAVLDLRVLQFTPPTPGLPLITSAQTTAEDLGRLRSAWADACADPLLAEAAADLLLDGFDVLPETAYDFVSAMERDAASRGYPELR
jgi:ABC-type phosphate/phosphonate transport system substrate-binding protein